MTPERLTARFNTSAGNDPVFKTVDGANSPNAPVATLDQKRAAYSMLLNRGVIRVGRPIPTGAEFSLAAVDDPYRFASASELSLFRRPLPTTNLKFVTAVMWDSRETITATTSSSCILGSVPPRCFGTTAQGLSNQSNDAVRGHAQAGADLTTAQRQAIVDFETALFTAQATDNVAGNLRDGGARGGPATLVSTPFYFGINDVVSGDYRTRQPFDPAAMSLFGAWFPVGSGGTPPTPAVAARQAIARGERVFNTRPFVIAGVRGFNDEIGHAAVIGTCTSCHDTPQSGAQSVPRMMDTGVSDGARRTPDLPLYTLRNNKTGETLQTTDPGFALTTGKWSDIGKMKVPSLRGLESRSPYFHNGFTGDLNVLLKFYDTRFQIGFSAQETADLIAFLKAL